MPVDSSRIFIKNIVVEGNRKTRLLVIEREMQLATGVTMTRTAFDAQKRLDSLQLLNSGLFSSVRFTELPVTEGSDSIYLNVKVKELWYIFPAAVFGLADRNFNVWLDERKSTFDRVNAGLKFKHFNLTGRADEIAVEAIAGFTPKLKVSYELPYLNRAGTWGLSLEGSWSVQREWAAKTDSAKIDFYKGGDDEKFREYQYTAAVRYRPGLYSTNSLIGTYTTIRIGDKFIRKNNPNYLGRDSSKQRVFSLAYEFEYDRRDVKPFPIRGNYLLARLNKIGMMADAPVNRLRISVEAQRFQPVTKRLSLAIIGKVLYDLRRNRVPYYNRVSLGFGRDFLRGYQYSVADGLDYGYLKTTARWMIMDRDVEMGFMPVRALKQIPFRLYLYAHGDLGRARDPFNSEGNTLANQTLQGYGGGSYIVLFRRHVIDVAFSRNHLGETGFYLNYELEI